ncbi:hypothetical protein ONZ45_g11959 [Pleurotus djamor]|nr:hypothetical protein ONZ45_g11959 [Pleurotus djamor]
MQVSKRLRSTSPTLENVNRKKAKQSKPEKPEKKVTFALPAENEGSPLICFACKKTFQTSKGTYEHISRSKTCTWWKKELELRFKRSNSKGKGKMVDRASSDDYTLGVDIYASVASVASAASDSSIRYDSTNNVEPVEEDDDDHGTELLQWEEPVPIPSDVNPQDFEDEIISALPPGALPVTDATFMQELQPDTSDTGPSTQPLDDDADFRHIVANERHAPVVDIDQKIRDKWEKSFGSFSETLDSSQPNPFLPFASELEWQIANWFITEDPGHNSVNRFLAIPEVVQKLGLSFKNAILGDSSTICPVIIASDKTQLSQFSGSKVAYPIYLTIGNIPKVIRRKPSRHACVLLGYLSADKVDKTDLTDKLVKTRTQRLFHKSLSIMLESLKEAGSSGVHMTDAKGNVRNVFPIISSYVADYPEQCLVACSKYGPSAKKRLGHLNGRLGSLVTL